LPLDSFKIAAPEAAAHQLCHTQIYIPALCAVSWGGTFGESTVCDSLILTFLYAPHSVSDNSKLNSMDSKNLAICWWPTLIPIDFTDMGHFEQLRPYLEDIVQTMIDQFPYLFCGKDAFVMV